MEGTLEVARANRAGDAGRVCGLFHVPDGWTCRTRRVDHIRPGHRRSIVVGQRTEPDGCWLAAIVYRAESWTNLRSFRCHILVVETKVIDR